MQQIDNLSHVGDIPCLPQQFLRAGGTLAQLEREFGIYAKRHGTYPNLIQLKYSQIEAPMEQKMVHQCRGIILNEDQNWAMVARPFDKFFNVEEPLASEINWERCVVQEKLDGSLIIMYWYEHPRENNGAWHAATSGTPDASGQVNGFGWTFAELFWSVWKESGYNLPEKFMKQYTFMWELMTPYNRVVVHHNTCSIKLIGIRNIWSGRELNLEYHNTRWPTVRTFPLNSITAIKASFVNMEPTEQEGYVVVDNYHRRVKVKHPRYVLLHHVRSNYSLKWILEVIRTGEETEFLNHFPEWKETFAKIGAAYDGLAAEIESIYYPLKGLGPGKEEQKAFALKVKDRKCSGVLFALRAGFIKTAKEGLKNMRIDHLIDALDLRDMKLDDAPLEEVA